MLTDLKYACKYTNVNTDTDTLANTDTDTYILYYAKSFRDASKFIAHQQQQTRPGQKVAPAPLGKYPRLAAVGAGRD